MPARLPRRHLIEVEAHSLREVQEVLECEGVGRILLDNMTPEQVQQAVELIGGRVETEASGGITLENVRQYALTGVQYISVGAITHSAPAVDISLELIIARLL